MITLKLKSNDGSEFGGVRSEYLFNAYLSQNKNIIKKLIKSIYSSYKIRESFFCLLNGFVDFSRCNESAYPGFIVRTDLYKYAVLYPEGSSIDDEEMANIIKEFIYDKGENIPSAVDIDKFEVSESLFLDVTKNI